MDFIERNKIDIMLINETELTSTIKCKIPGYTCFRRDRPGNIIGGGIKNSIDCSEIEFKINKGEAHGVKLPNNVTIISMYVPLQITIDTKDIDILLATANKVIIIHC